MAENSILAAILELTADTILNLKHDKNLYGEKCFTL